MRVSIVQMQQEQQGSEVKHVSGHSINIHLGSWLGFISLIVTHAHKGRDWIRLNLAPHTVPRELPDYRLPVQSTYDAADAMERIHNTKDAECNQLQQMKEDKKAILNQQCCTLT
eukprot:14674819-Ditylum_brightwellii.AAC.1